MKNPKPELIAEAVPKIGPLRANAVYRRKHLNDRFGGNRMTGIVASPRESVVLLFHTEEPNQQYYQDGVDEDGVYWYSGEGTSGDMQWNHANRAIRDHETNGVDLLLFERVQRKDGLWQFAGYLRCIDHRIENRPDITGAIRKAIVFRLIPIDDESSPTPLESRSAQTGDDSESIVVAGEVSTKERIQRIYIRSTLVAAHARRRANGVCEACELPAPFLTAAGEPYLEVHHIDRLSDGGFDKVDRVGAICPNCHRRCHYSSDAKLFNERLRVRVIAKESTSP